MNNDNLNTKSDHHEINKCKRRRPVQQCDDYLSKFIISLIFILVYIIMLQIRMHGAMMMMMMMSLGCWSLPANLEIQGFPLAGIGSHARALDVLAQVGFQSECLIATFANVWFCCRMSLDMCS